MGIIPDFDKKGNRITSKQKETAKNILRIGGFFLIFKLYYHLWINANKKQKTRMVSCWLLLIPSMATTSPNPPLWSFVFLGIWLFMIIYSSIKRWDEEGMNGEKKEDDYYTWYNTNLVWVWLVLYFPIGIIGLIKRYRFNKRQKN